MFDANMCIKQCLMKLVNVCLLRDEHFLVGNIFKTIWERGSRTCKSTKLFTRDRATYNVPIFFGFCWYGCENGPRITLERVSLWHLLIVRTKARTMGICSIGTTRK